MANIDIRLNDFVLPIKVKQDSDYYRNVCSIFNKYIHHIKKVSEIDENCKISIIDNCGHIQKSIQEYYNANFSEAEKHIMEVLKKYIDSPFIVAPMNENYAFKGFSPSKIQPSIYKNRYKEDYEEMQKEEIVLFRARIAIEKLERQNMLHIPLDQRGIVATQRFSMPGIPCFYFSTTSFGAWMEMGMPDTAVFQVAAFSIPKELKILNLCQQQLFIDGSASCINTKQELKNLYDFLEIFPLVIATSYRVLNNNNRSFKSEYIIPQLIMQVARKLEIDGVAYLSKRMDDCFAYPHCVNLAILIPYEQNNNTIYWSKINDILLTEPYFIHDMPKDYHGKSTTFINRYFAKPPHNQIKLVESEFEYSKLKFSEFDNYLLEMKMDRGI